MNVWDMAQWVLGGGMGPVAYFLMERVKFLREIDQSSTKRYVSFGVAILVAWVALFVTFWFGADMPVSPQEWVNLLGMVAFESVVVSQSIHGARKLDPVV